MAWRAENGWDSAPGAWKMATLLNIRPDNNMLSHASDDNLRFKDGKPVNPASISGHLSHVVVKREFSDESVASIRNRQFHHFVTMLHLPMVRLSFTTFTTGRQWLHDHGDSSPARRRDSDSCRPPFRFESFPAIEGLQKFGFPTINDIS